MWWTRAAGCFAAFRAGPKKYRADVAAFTTSSSACTPTPRCEVVCSARVRPVVVVPCCNFWLRDTKLGRDEFLDAIMKHHAAYGTSERAVQDFRGPHNRALVLQPARAT
jgi:hypothetical protein